MKRREWLKRSVTAGAIMMMKNFPETEGAAATLLKGLAAEYDKFDGLGLAELVAKRQVSPLELLDAVQEKVIALNPKLNAVCTLFFDKAQEQIKQGLPNGIFRGVPFLLKDLGQYLAGTVTSAGSQIFKNTVASHDSTLVTRYKQAGLVIFGKTATPEFGLTTTTESALFGKTRNPWNLERTSGGSSGGASAAVAARIVPMAHASDGGGSIRVPASCCGLFGFKPTRARVPMGPTQFEGWNGLSCHHAITLSVRDSAALLDVSAGVELGSPYSAPPPTRPFLKEVGANPGRRRIALVLAPTSGVAVDAECKLAATEAAKLCQSLGHTVEEAALPIDRAMLSESFANVLVVSIARTLDDAEKTIGHAVTEKDVEPVTWATAQAGKSMNSVVYSRALANLHQIGLAMAKFQQTYDVILSPTLAKPPVKLGLLSLSPSEGQNYVKEVTEFSPFTALYNVTGQPSMSVPLHWSAEGLPIGVMFSARFGDEATLFRLAAQLEKARSWAGRKPSLTS